MQPIRQGHFDTQKLYTMQISNDSLTHIRMSSITNSYTLILIEIEWCVTKESVNYTLRSLTPTTVVE